MATREATWLTEDILAPFNDTADVIIAYRGSEELFRLDISNAL